MSSDNENGGPVQVTFAMVGASDGGANTGPLDDATRDVAEVLAVLRDRLRTQGGAG